MFRFGASTIGGATTARFIKVRLTEGRPAVFADRRHRRGTFDSDGGCTNTRERIRDRRTTNGTRSRRIRLFPKARVYSPFRGDRGIVRRLHNSVGSTVRWYAGYCRPPTGQFSRVRAMYFVTSYLFPFVSTFCSADGGKRLGVPFTELFFFFVRP